MLFLQNFPPVLADVPSFTAEQVWLKIISNNNPLTVDTRSYESYKINHIPTAIYIDFSQEINSNHVKIIGNYGRTEHILYCSCIGGANAKFYGNALSAAGLTNVYYMSDDFRDWTYETITGENPGSVSLSTSNYTRIIEQNDKNNPSPLNISDFLPINIALTIVVVLIIIWKKKRTN